MAQERNQALMFAVRWQVVAKYSGQLALMVAVVTLPPLGAALLESHWAMAWRFGVLCVALSLLGAVLSRLTVPERIQVNEALTVSALAFLGAALVMSWPMQAEGLGFVDALFESISGVTTTGLSTLDNLEVRSKTFLFTRAWMQWYGGLGFIVLSVALLMGHQAASRRLVDNMDSTSTMMVTARTHALRTLIVYVVVTFAGLILVWPLAEDGLGALLHVLAAVSTGGFSSHTASLEGLSSRSAAVAVMIVSLLGAVSLHLYWRTARAGWRGAAGTLLADIELRCLLLLSLVVGGILAVLAWQHDVAAPWYHGFMIGVSAQTTTGFATMPVGELDPASKLVMIVSMLVGGSVGSSAGGIKILRFLIVLRLLQLMLRSTAMSTHAVAEPYLGEHRIESADARRALQLVLLFILVILASWFPFLLLGYDPLDALFEVVSAAGTVGLSVGITRPDLEPLLKAVLCFNMLAGRVEILALLVVLYPPTWMGRRERTT